MEKKLKAYVVQEGDEGCCTIEFATNGATARRQGASELNVEFEDVESCRRAPWADEFAPGPVPVRITLANGWWHTCSGCQCTFDAEGRRDGDDDREDEFEPVDVGGSSFCSPTCVMVDWAASREEAARSNAGIEAGLTKWPEAVSAWTFGKYLPSRGRELVVDILLPGLEHRLEWIPGESTASVAKSDLEAYIKLYGRKQDAESPATI